MMALSSSFYLKENFSLNINLKYNSNQKVTLILIAINVLFYLILLPFHHGLPQFGCNWQLVLLGHEWYRVIGAMFIHLGILHILCNMYTLYQLGSVMERELGSKWFLIAYLGTGIIANLSSVFGNFFLHKTVIAGGASGAICGILGVYIYYIRRRHVKWEYILRMMFPMIVITLVTNVDNFAHLGGLLAGYLFGLWFYMPKKGKKIKSSKFRVIKGGK